MAKDDKQKAIEAYQRVLKVKEKNKLDALQEYDYLKGKFEKAFTDEYEEGSDKYYIFNAMVKRLSELTREIKEL